MLCRKPQSVHVKKRVNGKSQVNEIPVGCGQCFHCRINQANVWQTRLILESQISIDSAFLTLTFDEIHLPLDGNVCPKFLKGFLKRYRNRLYPHKLRYYGIGEYGDETWRPHYHLAVFLKAGAIKPEPRFERCYLPCADMRKRNLCTHDCYLQQAWPYGNVEISRTLGLENAGYITGYIKKKATKPYYENLGDRKPEFMTCSTGNQKGEKGGLGYGAIEKIAKKFGCFEGSGGRIVRSIRQGGRMRPLGRYLSNNLRNVLGVSPEISDREFELYLQQVWDTFSTEEGRNRIEAKMTAREKRAELFKKRRSI